jgi:hypothetical protein
MKEAKQQLQLFSTQEKIQKSSNMNIATQTKNRSINDREDHQQLAVTL